MHRERRHELHPDGPLQGQTDRPGAVGRIRETERKAHKDERIGSGQQRTHRAGGGVGGGGGEDGLSVDEEHGAGESATV